MTDAARAWRSASASEPPMSPVPIMVIFSSMTVSPGPVQRNEKLRDRRGVRPRSHLPAERRGKGPELVHEQRVLLEPQRLRPVAQRGSGVGVYLDHYTVRTDGQRALGERRDQLVLAGRMAGVDYDRQVRKLLDQRYAGQVERVAGRSLERPYPALAQYNPRVAAPDDVLRGHEHLLDGVGEPAL